MWIDRWTIEMILSVKDTPCLMYNFVLRGMFKFNQWRVEEFRDTLMELMDFRLFAYAISITVAVSMLCYFLYFIMKEEKVSSSILWAWSILWARSSGSTELEDPQCFLEICFPSLWNLSLTASCLFQKYIDCT